MEKLFQVIGLVSVAFLIVMSTTQLVVGARSAHEGGVSRSDARQMLHSLVEGNADMQDMIPILFMLNRRHFLSGSIPLLVGGASVVVISVALLCSSPLHK